VTAQRLLGGALVLTRLLPVFLVPPFFGARRVPPALRIGLALAVAALFLPLTPHAPAAPGLLVALALKELLVGLALAFAVAMAFYGAEAGGRFIDLSRGVQAGEGLAPDVPAQPSALGELYGLLAIVLFLTSGGHRLFLASIAHSYEVLPLASFPSASGLWGMTRLVVATSGHVFVLALGMAAPVLAVLFLTDLAIGLLARSTPAIPMYLLALPARTLLGVAAFLAALSVTMPWLGRELGRVLDALAHTISRLAP